MTGTNRPHAGPSNRFPEAFAGAHSLVLAALVGSTLTLTASACNGGGRPRPVRPVDATSGEAADPAVRRAAEGNTIRWSGPITYHGVEVRFELESSAEEVAPTVRRTEYGDELHCGGGVLVHQYGGFRAAGNARYDFEDGSRVFVFRPPGPDDPWRAVGPRFTFTWTGNGESPVVREDRRDGTVVWTFRRTTLTLEPDRTITYRHRQTLRTFGTPVTLELAADGTLRNAPAGLRRIESTDGRSGSR